MNALHRSLPCLLVPCLLALTACPPGGGGPGADTDAATDADDVGDAPAPRPYRLGGRAEAIGPTLGNAETFSIDAWGDPGRLDAIVLPLDLFGVPWDAFVGGADNLPAELPAEWIDNLEAAEAALIELEAQRAAAAEETGEAPAEPQIILSLSPVTRDGVYLSPGTMDTTGKTPDWERCFDPAAQADPTRYAGRYAGYVTYLAKRFEPDMLILGMTMNRYEENCGQAIYEAMLGVTTEAHERLQLLDNPPTTILEVDVEDLYGYPKKPGRCVLTTPEACFEERRQLLEPIVADALGLHSQPAVALEDLEAVDQDWLARVADAAPTDTVVITATSLPATEITEQNLGGGPCISILDADEVDQRSWLDQVLSTAAARDMPLVVWHPLQDQMPEDVAASCPCSGDTDICFYLDSVSQDRATATRRLVTGGLWTHDDTPRLSGALWSEERAR